MTPRLRKFALLVHITFSVGWFGAIVPYLALAVAALTAHDNQTVRAACLSMGFIGWFIIVPFSLAALLSGLIQSLITQWGLLRHWWILAKLALTVVAVVILFQHMQQVSRISHLARETTFSTPDLRPELIHSGGGLLVLFAAMTLSVFKPWGMTPFGRRRTSEAGSSHIVGEPGFVRAAGSTNRPRWARIVGIHAAHAIVILLLATVIAHVAGMHHH